MRRTPLSLLTLALLGACAGQSPTRAAVQDPSVPPPLTLDGSSAYELAGRLELPEVPPGEYPGLHNVFRLSDSILSGAEPADEAALEQLAAWGVRTVISVDGKVPDVEVAASLGLRYVHVPIQYSGIEEDEVAKLAKSFRELEAPFYVHCYHGKHRGPAAAAIGRVVLDGLERDAAIAEMRQWCSTSPKYEGLYATVATADLPSAEESAVYRYDFASEHPFEGVRAVMIEMARTWDRVKLIERGGWAPDPEHPDIDPVREAEQVLQQYVQFRGLEAASTCAEDYHTYLAEGRAGAERLVEALRVGDLDACDEAFQIVKASCNDCHATYRNR